MRRTAEQPPVDTEDAVIWWATRQLVDPERFAADDRFPAWLGDPDHAAAWQRYADRDSMIGASAASPELYDMRAQALKSLPRSGALLRRWSAGLGIAASLVIAFAVTDVGLEHAPSPELVATNSPDGVQHYSTGRGERRDVLLSDGSHVALSADTVMDVRYSSERRSINLVAGQALFHVAKSRSWPFVVAAGGQVVTATGTAFDVRVGQRGEVRVLLVEGHVHVDPLRETGLARILPVLARAELDPGQQLVAIAGREPVVSVADVAQGTAWNRGLVVLRDDRLADAVDEFNRYSDTQILVEDHGLADLKVSGVFATARSDDFLAALPAMYPVRVKQDGKSIVLHWRRPVTKQK